MMAPAIVVSDAGRLPQPRAPARHRPLLCVAAVLAAWLLSDLFSSAAGDAGLRSTFVGPALRSEPGVRFGLSVPRGRVARFAEEGGEVVDAEEVPSSNDTEAKTQEEAKAEEGDAGEKVKSVFDGKKQKNKTAMYVIKRYNITYYVNRTTWTFTATSPKGNPLKGKWLKEWNMPSKVFYHIRPMLLRRWRKAKRYWRRHEKMFNQRARDGRLLYLIKTRNSPFTQKKGGKYASTKRIYTKKEQIRFERLKRAHELRRRLEVEAHETRMLRMKELGIDVGEPEWRKPYWMPGMGPRGTVR